ncbi:MAG: IS3 family transposase [Clostridium sp.]|nr:IS3 family transposase [Clostridium sp.]
MTITEILQLFELPEEWFHPSSRIRIKYDIRNAAPVNPPDELAWNNSQFVRIQRRRLIHLEQFAAQRYSEIREKLGSSDPETCLQVCEWIRDIPTGGKYQDSLSQILLKLGIRRSRFYRMCSDAFKAARKSRMEKKKQDLEAVRKTSEYGGYPKGSRQIYMQMDSVAHRHMSRRKIRNLMKEAGIVCPVRKANANRQKAREFLKTHVKPNLLRRRFRLNRPGKVFLTDVTYLDYGENQRAYGSACIDSVTGEVMDFTIRSENDLNLVKETLLALPDGQNESMLCEKLLLHSDQGVLYLTDDFQNTASSRNLTHSMSKRGNCWDNAPQESFFGHFKDECPYRDCSTLEEVQTAVKEYVIYYNTQRGQWNRNKMTPGAYREYLLNMNDAQYSAWMEEQEKHYAEMKKRAEQKAVERARTLGV